MLHMEQINHSFEVLINLLKKDNHLRGIAKDLKINHMKVKRLTDKLINENVLNVTLKGRNKVFNIKQTLEARNKVLMSEYYKLSKLINKHPELKRSIKELIKLKNDLIIVFGSYAKGIETKTSDVDIYIETNDRKIRAKVRELNDKFSVKIGLYNKKNLLIKEIEKNHVVIKGVEYFYEKNKFFN